MARILSHRVQAMNDLGLAYEKQDTMVESSERSALHSLIAGGLWIILIMACAFFLNRLIEHVFAGLSLERKPRTTLQAMLRISVRLIAVIVILMIIFGKPSNLSTVLGLAGAGLAVALQDFILSSRRWFVLMGRHAVRVGDWVEINPNSFAGVHRGGHARFILTGLLAPPGIRFITSRRDRNHNPTRYMLLSSHRHVMAITAFSEWHR